MVYRSKAQFTRCALAHVLPVFPPSLIYTRVLTMNEFKILASILCKGQKPIIV